MSYGYGSGQDSGWNPAATPKKPKPKPKKPRPKAPAYQASGSNYSRPDSGWNPAAKPKKPKPRRSRGHGAAAPYGPLRDSGYGTPLSPPRKRTSGGGTFGKPKPKGPTWKGNANHKFERKLGNISKNSEMKFGSSVPESRRYREGDKYRAPTSVKSNGLAAAAQRRKRGRSSVYTAGAGDSYEKISKATGVSAKELRKANPWMQKHHGRNAIYRNSKIRIPAGHYGTNWKKDNKYNR